MEYAYTFADFPQGKMSGGMLRSEIMAVISAQLKSIRTSGDDVFIKFAAALSPDQEAALDRTVHSHMAPVPPRRTVSVAGNGSVTASGNNQDTAAYLGEDRNAVTAATPNSGVRLPQADKFLEVLVVNQSGLPIKVYPPKGSSIGKSAANAPVTLADDAARMFYGFGNKWY